MAQDSSDSNLQEVVITGIRKSLESAQAIKQTSQVIVDSVTAQDIGALPDRSVAEALQRIPGVTLQRTDDNHDPARLASEGGAVFIRGLSWVRSELNGRDIFSANDGRNVSFEDISADLLAGIDVYKNPAADQVEGGVGGTVNLRTRLPFDSQKQLIAFSGDFNYADLLKKGFWSGNALYSNQWETDIGRLGGLASASIGNIGNRTDSIQLGRFVPQVLPAAQDGLAAGSNVYIPNSMGWRRIDWQQRRVSLAGAFQWSPSEEWVLSLQALHATANPHDLEFADGDYGAYLGDSYPYSATHFNSSGILTSGTLPITPQLDTRYEQQHHSTTDVSFNTQWQATSRLQLTADLQYIKSHADITSLTAFTQEGDAAGAAIPDTTLTFDISGRNPYMLLNQNPNQTANPANYWWAAAMDHLEDNDAHAWAERLDGDYKFEDNDWVDSFRFGIRATDKSSVTRETGYNWAILSHQYWGGGAPMFLDSSTPAFASQLVTYNDFFRGKVQLPGVGYFPSYQLVRNGTAYAYSILKNVEDTAGGWTPLTTDWSKAIPGGDNPISGINDQHERTYAAYGLVRFAHDNTWLGRMDGNVGVRIVRTQEHASTGSIHISSLTSPIDPATCVANNGAAACQFLINAIAFTQGASQSFTFPDNNYTDVLPTANIRFMLTKELQLRFAAGKAIVRPTFKQMSPYTSVGFSFLGNTGYLPAAVNSQSGSGGNPDLKPTRANQFDTSLEWYFAPTGSLTFDFFYKSISNYIFAGNDAETLTSNGVTETFQVTRYQNGSKGRIRGFELGYQQFFDFLPGPLAGLGVQGNLTLVDSDGGRNTALNVLDTNQTTGAADQTLPLEGMSRWSYNANLIYERWRISARLAWNWRERYLLTTSAANINAPVWSENYGQLDGELFVTATSNVKVGIQATNLLNRRTFLDVGGAELAPRYSWTDTDRRYAIAVRAQF